MRHVLVHALQCIESPLAAFVEGILTCASEEPSMACYMIMLPAARAPATHRIEELVLALEVQRHQGEAVEALDLGRGGKHAHVLVRALPCHVDVCGTAA
jgi:hypothetical protein